MELDATPNPENNFEPGLVLSNSYSRHGDICLRPFYSRQLASLKSVDQHNRCQWLSHSIFGLRDGHLGVASTGVYRSAQFEIVGADHGPLAHPDDDHAARLYSGDRGGVDLECYLARRRDDDEKGC